MDRKGEVWPHQSPVPAPCSPMVGPTAQGALPQRSHIWSRNGQTYVNTQRDRGSTLNCPEQGSGPRLQMGRLFTAKKQLLLDYQPQSLTMGVPSWHPPMRPYNPCRDKPPKHWGPSALVPGYQTLNLRLQERPREEERRRGVAGMTGADT